MFDEELMQSEVYRGLDYEWSWRGLTVADLPILMLPGIISFPVCVVLDINVLWMLGVLFSSAAAMVMLKYKKDKDYIFHLFQLILAPRRLSHKESDFLPDFPIEFGGLE